MTKICRDFELYINKLVIHHFYFSEINNSNYVLVRMNNQILESFRFLQLINLLKQKRKTIEKLILLLNCLCTFYFLFYSIYYSFFPTVKYVNKGNIQRSGFNCTFNFYFQVCVYISTQPINNESSKFN